jgi:hypothetical protein
VGGSESVCDGERVAHRRGFVNAEESGASRVGQGAERGRRAVAVVEVAAGDGTQEPLPRGADQDRTAEPVQRRQLVGGSSGRRSSRTQPGSTTIRSAETPAAVARSTASPQFGDDAPTTSPPFPPRRGRHGRDRSAQCITTTPRRPGQRRRPGRVEPEPGTSLMRRPPPPDGARRVGLHAFTDSGTAPRVPQRRTTGATRAISSSTGTGGAARVESTRPRRRTWSHRRRAVRRLPPPPPPWAGGRRPKLSG